MENIEALEREFREAPDTTLFAPLSEAYLKQGRPKEAEDLLKEGILKHPNYLPAHLLLGRCYKEDGRYEEAREEFNKVLNLDKTNIPAYRELAEIYEKLEDKENLSKTYKTILKLYPYDEKAKEYLKREKEPKPFATIAIAKLYESQGLFKEALEIYKQVLEREPENEEAKRKVEELKGYEE